MEQVTDEPAAARSSIQNISLSTGSGGGHLTGRGKKQKTTKGDPYQNTHPIDGDRGPSHIYNGGNKLNQVLTVSSPSFLISFNPITTALPPNLGKIATRLTARLAQIGFFPECGEARGLLNIQQPHLDRHQTTALLNHARQHGLHISLPQGMSEE